MGRLQLHSGRCAAIMWAAGIAVSTASCLAQLDVVQASARVSIWRDEWEHGRHALAELIV
jgi:hypothetical protein